MTLLVRRAFPISQDLAIAAHSSLFSNHHGNDPSGTNFVDLLSLRRIRLNVLGRLTTGHWPLSRLCKVILLSALRLECIVFEGYHATELFMANNIQWVPELISCCSSVWKALGRGKPPRVEVLPIIGNDEQCEYILSRKETLVNGEKTVFFKSGVEILRFTEDITSYDHD